MGSCFGTVLNNKNETFIKKNTRIKKNTHMVAVSLSGHLQRSMPARVVVSLSATVAVVAAAVHPPKHPRPFTPAVTATCFAGLILMVLCVWTSVLDADPRLHAGSGVAAAVLGSVVAGWSRNVVSITLACAAWVCMAVWWWWPEAASAVVVETAGVGLGLASTVLAISKFG